MNETKIKKSIENLTPNDVKKQKIYFDVMKRQQRHVPRHRTKIGFAAFGVVLLFLISGRLVSVNNENELQDLSVNDSKIETDLALVSTFLWQGKTYVPLDTTTANQWGVSLPVLESQIGEKLTTIENAGPLTGCEVYTYTPAQAQALVVVKKDSDYHLYQFMTFERYDHNQDEDAIAYLALYGIHEASDIKAIEIGNRTITDEQEIETFYQYYKPLQNSSDAYFETVVNSNQVSEIARMVSKASATKRSTNPDTAVSSDGNVMESEGRAEGNQVSSSSNPGSTTGLEHAVTIRIHATSGLIYETIYYPEIGFISRFKIGEDFAKFLKQIDRKKDER